MNFVNDLVNNPLITLLLLGNYAKDLVVWVGAFFNADFSALGNVAFIVVEVIILGYIYSFVMFVIRRIVDLVNLIRAGRGRK